MFIKLATFSVLVALVLQTSCMTSTEKESGISSSSSVPEHLISSFDALCPTTGSWTLVSLGEARKIKTVLTTLREDPKCQDIAYAVLDNINSLQNSLSRMEENSLKRDILGVQREQLTIMNMLKQIEDGATTPLLSQEALELKFSENQLALAVYRGQLGYDQREARNAHMATTIVQTTASIFDQMSLAQECLIKSPQLFSGLVSMGTALASSIADGGASLALASSHHLLGNLFEFYRKSELNKQIAKFNQGEFSSAYQCVLESLSNQWCDAMEMHDLINFRIKNKSTEVNLFSQGIKIINRDLPVLSSWLTKLTSPDTPVNSAHAFRQTRFLKRENMIKIWRTNALGILGDAEENLPKKLTGEEQRRIQFTILQSTILNMDPKQMQSPDVVKNPIYDVINAQEFSWYLIGVKPQNIPTNKGKEVLDFADMTPKLFRDHPSVAIFYPLSPEKIRGSINRIYGQVSKMLDTQKADILNADSHSLLWDAEDSNYSGVPGISGVSPLNAIDNILDYLKVYAVGGLPTDCSSNMDLYRSYKNMDQIYAGTQSILCGIKKQIKTKNKDYRSRLQEISSLAHLDSGVSFIRDRVERIVKLALRNYLKTHGHEINAQKKLLLVEDIIAELSQYGSSNLVQIKFDIQNAMKNFEETTQNFAETFSESLDQTVKYIYEKNVNDPITNNLVTKYCALLLAVPNWNSKELEHIDLSLCHGRGLISEWNSSGDNFEFSYSEELYRSNFNRKRMCHFRRFLRKEEFLQNYRYDIPAFLKR